VELKKLLNSSNSSNNAIEETILGSPKNLEQFRGQLNVFVTYLHDASPLGLSSHIPPFWQYSEHLCPEQTQTYVSASQQSTTPHRSPAENQGKPAFTHPPVQPIAHLSMQTHMLTSYKRTLPPTDINKGPKALCFVAPMESHWPFVELWITDFDGRGVLDEWFLTIHLKRSRKIQLSNTEPGNSSTFSTIPSPCGSPPLTRVYT